MGILTRFTLRSLARNRARTAVSVIGIALSCALITAIFTTVTSIGGGLLQRTLELSGSWQVMSPRVSDSLATSLQDNSHVTNLALGRELGSARLSDQAADTLGTYLTVKSLPASTKGDADATGERGTEHIGLTQLPEMKAGAAPADASQVMLPSHMQGTVLDGTGASSEGALTVGSVLTLELGDRVLVDEQGREYTLSSTSSYQAANSSAYGDDQDVSEELRNVRTRTFTVSGFYDNPGYWSLSGEFVGTAAGTCLISGPIATSSAATPVANTDAAGADLSRDGFIFALMTCDFTSYADLDGWATAHFASSTAWNTIQGSGASLGNSQDSDGYILNTDLLRYQGMTEGRAIWDTLWQLAAILTGVVMAASVSLIYTSFAISVTERMRQFGLLSGIGASKRQLRCTVIAEAIAMGCAGIPLGLALGVAGTAVTLHYTQAGFASMLGTNGGVTLAVSPAALGISAAIALVTLFISAWVPALRAGRVSAIDAIRQARTVREGRLRGRLGGHIAQRLFGVPGLVAHRNLTRSGSRGRIVVASLAVSVALVITCGVIDAYMRPLAGVASRAGGSQDDITLHLGSEGSSDGADVSASFAQTAEALARKAAALEGVSMNSLTLNGTAEAVIPAGLYTQETRDHLTQSDDTTSYSIPTGTGTDELAAYPDVQATGDWVGTLGITYLPDADWSAYLEQLGLDKAAYTDPANPRAIVYNAYEDTMGERYVSLTPWAKAGTIETLCFGDGSSGYPVREGYMCMGIGEDSRGSLVVRYLKLDYSDEGYTTAAKDEQGNYVVEEVPASEFDVRRQQLEIGVLADQQPAGLSSAYMGFPTVYLPASALATHSVGAGGTLTATSASYGFAADDDREAQTQLESLASELSAQSAEAGHPLNYNVYNQAANTRDNANMAALVQLFVLLFSAITMLIALANVFNTLTNSIILRTREFAVLKSAGMGMRAFGAMIVYECASYAWRGLAAGLVLGMGVSVLMWRAMEISFLGISVAVPWAYIGIAVVGAACVLGLSCLYALRRSHAQNVVEALRQDAL